MSLAVRSRAGRIAGALALLILASTTTAAPAAAGGAVSQAGRGTAYVSPAGSGRSCTSSQPCSDLSAALAVVRAVGGRVLLASGRYPALAATASSNAATTAHNVTVSPAPGAHPVLGSVRTSAAHVTWSHLDVAGIFYFTSAARGSVLVDSHVRGRSASVVVRASHVTVRHNLIEGGHAHDGLNIAGYPSVNRDIKIIANTIRDFTEGTPTQEHADCIQLFDTSNVLIERNNLFDCYASGIRFSPGARKGISDVRIVSNFVQGCLPGRQRCPASVAADLRHPATGVSITHNTFGHGIVFLPSSGATATDDIVGYLSVDSCASILRHSVITYFLSWKCSSHPPGRFNRTQAVRYAAPAHGDLHLRSSIAGVTPAGGAPGGPVLDIDRQPFTTGVPGADQP